MLNLRPLKRCLYFALALLISCGKGDDGPVLPEPQPSAENLIVSFLFEVDGEQFPASVNQVANIVEVELPYQTDLSSLAPSIWTSTKSSVSPASGTSQNFESSINYVVTAENGDTRSYEVIVTAPSDQNFITSFSVSDGTVNLIGAIDETSRRIRVELPDGVDWEVLTAEVEHSALSGISPNPMEPISLKNGTVFRVTAENGDTREYTVSPYSVNLLENPSGENGGLGWDFKQTVGVEPDGEGNNQFFVIYNEVESEPPAISQIVEFQRDYSNKYILFIGDLNTEKTIDGSITRHPYFWGFQYGPFNYDDDYVEEVLQGDMIHTAPAQTWQVVWDAKKLLDDVEGVQFQMAQARHANDPSDGTKCMFRKIEMRIFQTKADAEWYVSELYASQ